MTDKTVMGRLEVVRIALDDIVDAFAEKDAEKFNHRLGTLSFHIGIAFGELAHYKYLEEFKNQKKESKDEQ